MSYSRERYNPRNKYPGICYRCGKNVEVGQGHFQRSQQNIKVKFATKWLLQHSECVFKHKGTDHCFVKPSDGKGIFRK